MYVHEPTDSTVVTAEAACTKCAITELPILIGHNNFKRYQQRKQVLTSTDKAAHVGLDWPKAMCPHKAAPTNIGAITVPLYHQWPRTLSSFVFPWHTLAPIVLSSAQRIISS
jgi:hypothetical protein